MTKQKPNKKVKCHILSRSFWRQMISLTVFLFSFVYAQTEYDYRLIVQHLTDYVNYDKIRADIVGYSSGLSFHNIFQCDNTAVTLYQLQEGEPCFLFFYRPLEWTKEQLDSMTFTVEVELSNGYIVPVQQKFYFGLNVICLDEVSSRYRFYIDVTPEIMINGLWYDIEVEYDDESCYRRHYKR